MTSPGARPAAELLAEWDAMLWYYPARALAAKRYGGVLRRLVLAEQSREFPSSGRSGRELLTEWRRRRPLDSYPDREAVIATYEEALVEIELQRQRLARAEQALAENADAWDEGASFVYEMWVGPLPAAPGMLDRNPYRAALRASQEADRG